MLGKLFRMLRDDPVRIPDRIWGELLALRLSLKRNVVLEGKLTQSDVPPDFLITVPLYFDFDGHWVAVGRVRVLGDWTANVKVTLPKMPKRVSINANHDVLALETSVKKL